MKPIYTTARTVLIIFLSSLFLVSCEDVVDVKLEEENIDLISVEAYINTQETDNIYVKIQRSLPVSDAGQNPALLYATVEISDDQESSNSVVLEDGNNTGIYRLPANTSYRAEPGKTYALKITTAGGIVITAKDYLQKVENLDSVKINLSPRGDYEFLAVYISSQETPGLGNYYKWDIYNNGVLLNKSEQMSFVSDELVDGNYVSDFEIFTDWYDEKEVDEDGNVISGPNFKPGDTVYVEQLSISRAAYDFYIGMVNQAFTGTPFSVPPANAPGNFTSSDGKKVLGLFSARDVSPGNVVIIDSSNYTPLVPGMNYFE